MKVIFILICINLFCLLYYFYHHETLTGINNNNLCVYFSSMNDNISTKRRKNLIEELNKYNLKYEIDTGVTNKALSTKQRQFFHILNKLESFSKSNFKYALICDDDFVPINNFYNELLSTLKYVDCNFRMIFLCIGYLWGRKYKHFNKTGRLRSEGYLFGLKHNERVFYDIDKNEWIKRKMWLGGPIAILVNKSHIQNLIFEYKQMFYKLNQNVNNDVLLLYILNNKDFVCREPQLGYENEQGGSLY